MPNTTKWQGVSCAIYMLDLGQQSNARMTNPIPKFWTGQGELDRLRRAKWVYSPTWKGEGRDEDDLDLPDEVIDGQIAPYDGAALAFRGNSD